MITLHIDGVPVVTKSGSTIKLVRENPIFTEAGDYTFDITLPLAGCPQNQRALGLRHRPEVRLDDLCGKRMPFLLQTAALHVQGTAVVTSVNQEEAKVQLLAGASDLNVSATTPTGTDVYIDELDLGKAYEKEAPDAYAGDEDRYIGDSKYTLSPRDKLRKWVQEIDNDEPIYGFANVTDCVLFPVWSSADDGFANARGLREFFVGETKTDEKYRYPITSASGTYDDGLVFAAQPYLVVIIERVLKALGYRVGRNDIRDTWMKDIFIANTRSEYKFANIMPHWTVREFLDEVRRFFGVAIVVPKTGVAEIVSRANYYKASSSVISLKEVSDEHSADIDDDEDGSKDISTANVDYEHPDTDDMLRLPDEVWENAIVKVFTSETILVQWVKQNIPEDKRETSAWLLVDEGQGHTFAYLRSKQNDEYHLVQVDCCPPLIRGGGQYRGKGRDIGVTLRIVPAMMEWVKLTYIKSTVNGRYYDNTIVQDCMPVPTLVSSDTLCKINETYSVDAAINSDSSSDQNTTDERPDILRVALNTGKKWKYNAAEGNTLGPKKAELPVPLGIAYCKQNDGYYIPIIGAGNKDQFNLTKMKSPSIRADAIETGYHVDTRCLHCFSFTDDCPIDVAAVFLIRNRRYVCQKIEYEIDEDGVRPMKRGYFYELNQD